MDLNIESENSSDEELSINYNTNNMNNTRFIEYQQNAHMYSKPFKNNLEYDIKALPLSFFLDYKDVKIYEYSKKIILPKSLLYQLSSYENLSLPIFIKINNFDILFGVIDYYDFIDHAYIPSDTFYNLGITEDEEIKITILHENPINAISIDIKPLSDEFYLIPNIKQYLEIMLKKMAISLTQGEIISLPYTDKFIKLEIVSLEPFPVVSIYDLEEVDITILPMIEPQSLVSSITKTIDETSKNTKDTIDTKNTKDTMDTKNTKDTKDIKDTKNNTNQSFVSFSGKGNTLGTC